MTRAEFLQAYPREPIKIMTGDSLATLEVTAEFPVGADEIACDACSADPGDTVFVDGGRAMCLQCFETYIRPYLMHKG